MKKIILTFSLLCAIVLLVFLMTQSNSTVGLEPTVYYLSGIIDSFDEGGNALGTYKITKLDGYEGEPQYIYSSDNNEILFNSDSINFVDGYIYLLADVSEDTQLVKKIDYEGNIISEEEYTLPKVFSNQIFTSPDKRYQALINTEFIPDNEGGPGDVQYTLVIKDLTDNMTNTININDFKYQEVAFDRIFILDFSGDSKSLYLELSEFYGDISNPTVLFEYNLTTQEIIPLFGGGEGINILSDRPYAINYIKSNIQKTEFYLSKQYYDSENSGEILAYNINTKKLTKLIDSNSDILNINIRPDGQGAMVEPFSGEGFYYYDFYKKKKTPVVDKGYFKDWSEDGKYFVYTIIQDMMDTLGPQKVILRNFETNKEKVIYEQKVSTFLEDYKAQVGDKLYNYLSVK